MNSANISADRLLPGIDALSIEHVGNGPAAAGASGGTRFRASSYWPEVKARAWDFRNFGCMLLVEAQFTTSEKML